MHPQNLLEILLEEGKGFLSPRFLAPPEEGTSEKRRGKENRSGVAAYKQKQLFSGKNGCEAGSASCNHFQAKEKSDRK